MQIRADSAQQAPMHLKHLYLAQNVAQENRQAQSADQALQFALIAKKGRIRQHKVPQFVLRALQVHIQGQRRQPVLCVHQDTIQILQWQLARQHARLVLRENILYILLRHAMIALLALTRLHKRRSAIFAFRERIAQESASQHLQGCARNAWQEHIHCLDSQLVSCVCKESSILSNMQAPVQTVQEDCT